MELLFHHDVIVATLASGSRGNCTYVGDFRSGVLVDCGLSTRQVLARLDALGLGHVRIDAVLVTHEHADHVGAARILDERLFAIQGERVPFHLSRGTRSALDERCTPSRVELCASGRAFRAGGFTVEPYTVPHDTRDPLSFLLTRGDTTVGVLTDLGRVTRLVEQQVARMSIAVLEFNHDLEMLLDGPYPWSLKQRVRGPHGHLSNAQAAELLRSSASSRLEHVLLAHLSDDNNRAELAVEAALTALADVAPGAQVSVACQDRPVGPFRVAPRLAPPTRIPVPSRRLPRPPPGRNEIARQLTLF